MIDQVFAQLPSVNFSEAILTKIPHRMCVMEIDDVYWSDWGDEQRIRYDIERLGLSFHDHIEA